MRPVARSFRAASSTCTRRALAVPCRSRQRWRSACTSAACCGTPLTTEQKNLITPARSDIIAVYRELQARRWHAEDLQPLCAKLGEENTGKTLVAVTALEQVGLIAAAEKGGAKVWELVPTAGKKNLADAPILKCLEGM